MKLYTARIALSLSTFAVAAIVGCKDSGTTPFINDQFPADDAPRSVDLLMAQQTANAAREDGTFYASHFTAGRLNSLGYAKLSKMAHGDADGQAKLAIFIDLKGDAFTAAHDSLTDALTKAGYASDAFSITAGANPNVGAPAVSGLRALDKQSGVAGGSESDKMEAYGKGVGAGLGSSLK